MNKNDVEEYLDRLNIQAKEPSFDLVKAIQKKHIESFSFNNIAVFLEDEISLNTDTILEKIVRKNYGGYCFEHNQLLHDILNFLGFKVRLLIAKVLMNQDIDTARTHRITLLEYEGKNYIVDVGFGSMCPREPIEVQCSNTTNSCYRISKRQDKDYQLEQSTKQKDFVLYKFNLENYTQVDCVMGNFYSSHYPQAVFVNNFVLSLIMDDITLSLRNNIYHRITKYETEVIDISSTEQLHDIINNDFNISLSIEECKKIFNRIDSTSEN